MEATKDYISLETAKILKDCGIKSKFSWCENKINENYIPKFPIKTDLVSENNWNIPYPAYIWKEILWEYEKVFFGEKEKVVIIENTSFANHEISTKYLFGKTAYILDLLQNKKYEEADLYFRNNCILIK